MKVIARRAIIAAVAAVVAFAGWVALPVPRRMLSAPAAPSVTLRDRHGIVLRTTRASDGTRQRWVSLADMDPQVVQAFLAVEDRRFFEHHGVDLRAMARAFASDARSGRVVSGASTITMQLARELTGAGRSWPGKLAQIAWALRLDAHSHEARDPRAIPEPRRPRPSRRRRAGCRRIVFWHDRRLGRLGPCRAPRGDGPLALARKSIHGSRARSRETCVRTDAHARTGLRHGRRRDARAP